LDNEQIRNAVLLSYIEEAKLKIWINAKTEIATELAIKENITKADLPVERLIPEDLHDFLDVFDNDKVNWFPEFNVWDHKIDMKEGFEPESFKNYNLTPEEQKELDKFKFGKRVYSTISITSSITFLLCQKERWKTLTMSRLLILKWLDS
jgi:hypothetical protein